MTAITQKNVSLTVSRVIDAPRDTLFNAWLDPEIRKLWWLNHKDEGPLSVDLDGREGGTYKIVQTHDSCEHVEPDGFQWIMTGEFLEVTPLDRIVFTWNVNHTTEPIENQRVTVDFADDPGGTKITITHEGVMSEQIAQGHEKGWTGMLENIDKALAD